MDTHFSAAVLCNARWWVRFNTKLTHLERDFQRRFCPHQKNNSISSLVTRQEGWYWVILKVPSFCSLTMLFNVGDNIIVMADLVWSKPRCALNTFLTSSKGKSIYTFTGWPNSMANSLVSNMWVRSISSMIFIPLPFNSLQKGNSTSYVSTEHGHWT